MFIIMPIMFTVGKINLIYDKVKRSCLEEKKMN